MNDKDQDTCKLCGAVGADKRTLRMSCLYELTEVVPEMSFNPAQNLFELRICKSCRGSLLDMLKQWRDAMILRRPFEKDHDGNLSFETDGLIPVRVNGRICNMTPIQYAEWVAMKESEE